MGMPCEVNTVLKLNDLQYSPLSFERGSFHEAFKGGYRIIPLDTAISLVNKDWDSIADIVVHKLTWENNKTFLRFEVVQLHESSLNSSNKIRQNHVLI